MNRPSTGTQLKTQTQTSNESQKITGFVGKRKRQAGGTLGNERELIDCGTEHHEIKDNLIGSPGTIVWLSAKRRRNT